MRRFFACGIGILFLFFFRGWAETKFICVGVSNYKSKQVKVIPSAVSSAQAMRECLRQKLCLKPENIFCFFNEAATKKIILGVLNQNLSDLKKEDDLIFYWCGHSTLVGPKQNQVALMVYDSGGPNFDESVLYPQELVEAMVKNSRVGKVVLIFDCCVSGRMIRAIQDLEGEWKERMKINILTSSDDEIKQGSPAQYHMSYFAHFFIKGMRGKADFNQDAQVTCKEIMDYLKKELDRDELDILLTFEYGQFVLKRTRLKPQCYLEMPDFILGQIKK